MLISQCLLICISLLIGCGDVPNTNYDKSSVAGRWEKTIKQERFVFVIEKSSAGSFSGTIETHRQDNLISKTPLNEIVFKNLQLSMITNQQQGIMFKGILDTSEQIIRGKLIYRSGSTFPFNLKRENGTAIAEMRNSEQNPIFKYMPADQLPPVEVKSGNAIFPEAIKIRKTNTASGISRKDALAMICRRHGEIFCDYQSRSTALLLAFLIDPLTAEISRSWQKETENENSVEAKVAAMNRWNIDNMAYTQVSRKFSEYPGKDPWGTFPGNHQPVFKKLIPPEMKAMQLHTGKISGKCFTLINLIISAFMETGVNPDNIVVLVKNSDAGRHAMALVKYKGEVLLVNLMMVGLLKKQLQKDFGDYEIIGVYNLWNAQKTDIRINRDNLLKLIKPSEKSLSAVFYEQFNLSYNPAQMDEIPLMKRDQLYREVIENKHNNELFKLAQYACQYLGVNYPEIYLTASLQSSLVQELAAQFSSTDEVLDWISKYIRYGSIFADAETRIMTADQVLVFQRGGFKDQAVLAYALLKEINLNPAIEVSADNAFIRLGDKIYDFRRQSYVKSTNVPIFISLK